MKILLLHSGTHIKGGKVKRVKVVTDHTLPLGILYLGEILKRNNYDVELFDHAIANLPVDKLVKWILKNNYDIVGFSVLEHNYFTSIEIAKKLKKSNENIVIIFGGVHSTLWAPEILQKYAIVDYCVRGEGEYAFLELIKAIESNNDIKNIKGITYRENDLVKSTEDRPFIENLDEIPIPDRKMLTKYHKYVLGLNVSPIITSRGCPYNCTYCCCNILNKRRVRFRSVKSVVDELIYLESEGFKEINIVDDCFTLNKKRVIKICEEIRKEKLDLQWHASCRTNLGNLNMYRHMALAGCATASFGIESANQRILDYYNKGTTVEQAKISVKNAKKADIPNIYGAFIIGAPTETYEEVINTLKFGLNLNLTIMQFQLLHIIPKTPIFYEFVENGWLDEDEWESHFVAADVCPNTLPKDLLVKLIEAAYIEMVSDPKRIFREYLWSIKSKYRTKMFRNLPHHFRRVLSG